MGVRVREEEAKSPEERTPEEIPVMFPVDGSHPFARVTNPQCSFSKPMGDNQTSQNQQSPDQFFGKLFNLAGGLMGMKCARPSETPPEQAQPTEAKPEEPETEIFAETKPLIQEELKSADDDLPVSKECQEVLALSLIQC